MVRCVCDLVFEFDFDNLHLSLTSCLFVRWHSTNGRYRGKYVPWCDDDGNQYVGDSDDETHMIKRGAIAVKGVKFTQKQVHPSGGYYLLNADTKRRLETHEKSDWKNYN